MYTYMNIQIDHLEENLDDHLYKHFNTQNSSFSPTFFALRNIKCVFQAPETDRAVTPDVYKSDSKLNPKKSAIAVSHASKFSKSSTPKDKDEVIIKYRLHSQY